MRAPQPPPAFEVTDLHGRGKCTVVTRRLPVDAEVFNEEPLLTVKTIMLLSGVVVIRRSRVDRLYERLSPEGKRLYQSLPPIGLPAKSSAPSQISLRPADVCALGGRDDLRWRGGRTAGGAAGAWELGGEGLPPASVEAGLQPPTASQHRLVWDRCAVHYCDDSDVRINRCLHLFVFPVVLSVVTGALWAWWWRGEYIRSTLGACVLFFVMLGPFSVKVLYVGSQALCVQTARVNHSCVPNAAWQISGQKGILGGAPVNPASVALSELPLRPGDPVVLTMRTKRAVAKGEELTIDYIADLTGMAPETRQQLLQEEYGFLCDCRRCQEAVKIRGQASTASPACDEPEDVW